MLGLTAEAFDGVITSPPYLNRHDYTRVFHIELLMMGRSEAQIKQLRYSSLRSNVEARPTGKDAEMLPILQQVQSLNEILSLLAMAEDQRIEQMARGYFLDMLLCLLQMKQTLKAGGHAALVLGNVRHAGVIVPVDEITAAIAELVGLDHESTWVVRLRGNSAQQMGRYGRELSREGIVILRKRHGQ
jgi:hypothetical protein